jgi:hypothetical protein
MQPFTEPEVENIFLAYPEPLRSSLLEIREMIFAQAVLLNIPITETIRWWQASYIPVAKNTGTTIRIDTFGDTQVAIFFNCKTSIVQDIKNRFADQIQYSKNRAIVFNAEQALPTEIIKYAIQAGLTYFKQKKTGRA